MNFEVYVQKIKQKYHPGMRIQLDVDMNDDSPHKPKKGDVGTVVAVDDYGVIRMRWDCGSSLGLIPGEDEFCVVEE